MKKVMLLLVVALVGFTACKKEETGTGSGSKSTEEKIIGLWMGNEIETSVTAPPPVGTQNQTEDISYLNVEFKNDGTAVADSAGFDPEVSTWALIGDDKIILDSDTFDIQVLNDSQFHFGGTEQDTFMSIPVQVVTSIKLKK